MGRLPLGTMQEQQEKTFVKRLENEKNKAEVDVLPLPESPGNPVPGRRDGDGDCDEYGLGIVEDTQAARESV